MLHIYTYDSEKTSEYQFYKKLNKIHEKYVYYLILNGVSEKGEDLESIKMTKNPDVSRKYCERVVGGLKNVKPLLISKLSGDTGIECVFTKLADNDLIGNALFMIQIVNNYPVIGKYSCQIWYLGETYIGDVKDIWDE